MKYNNAEMFPEIKTERLLIRPFKEDDLEDLYGIYMDEKTCRYLLHDAWNKDNKHQHFQKILNNDSLSEKGKLNLACVKDDKVTGNISIMKADMKETLEIGYVFDPACRGLSYSDEALKAVIAYLFRECGVHRIFANMDARNSASAALCERLGMRKEAHFIKDYWNKGEWTDSCIYAVLADEFCKTDHLS